MKTNLIKSLATLLLLQLALASFGYNGDPNEIKERLENVRTQITEYIENPDLTGTEIKEIEATLHFVINKKSELVVVFVDSKDDFVDLFLKERLNYKFIEDNLLRGPYSMKIIIKNGSLF
ncbi:MAG: hypothetical protein IPL46_26905 [Saprospiraceae bacterium]|nr:hypothetical protein [Saprospiraceae bacterium]